MEVNVEQLENPRIAIYSQDGLGLGHMRRTSAIAWQIYLMRPGASILTLSDSLLGQFFKNSPHHDYLKLPSIVKESPGNWQPASLHLSFEAVLEMRKQLIRSALTSFMPHVLLVDHMPHGAMGELLPALEALNNSWYKTEVVLGLRDILDKPEVIQHRWQMEGAYEAIEKYYSRVLIYGMRELYDLENKYQFPEPSKDKTRYCGYVCSQEDASDADNVRAAYLAGTLPGTRFIVAMAGGGADAFPMMSALLDALPLIQQEMHCVVALITGPFMPQDHSDEINRRARHAPVRVLESVEDTLSYISAADLVISMAGYNTSVEILHMKKPAIFIPRSGPSVEQRMRAQLFAARNWVEWIDPDELTVDLLSQKVVTTANRVHDYAPAVRPNLHGASLAANQILSLLSQHPDDQLALIGARPLRNERRHRFVVNRQP